MGSLFPAVFPWPARRVLAAAVLVLALACLAAGPAAAGVPEPLKPPPELPVAQRAELERQRGELLLQWDGLVEQVRAHNRQCRGVVPSSPQGVRCQVELKGIKERIGAHLKAVKRHNLRVTAATLRQQQSPARDNSRP